VTRSGCLRACDGCARLENFSTVSIVSGRALGLGARFPELATKPIAGWGAPDRLADLGLRTHTGGNCLQACVSMLLGQYVSRANVPDPTPFFSSHGDDWREAYNDELARKTRASSRGTAGDLVPRADAVDPVDRLHLRARPAHQPRA
jgi:hypothetical protein